MLRETGHTAPTLIDDGVTPDRNFWLYLLFSVLTLGLFSIWWLYVIFRDGNVHTQNDAFMEDQLLNALRLAA